ncbi:MAG: archaeal proteasome endopeptidase complex subunit alpha [Candidatus Diapherotrites archaeon]
MYPNPKSQAYDRAATMFSPDGRLYQVEYASKIVAQGTLGLGLIYDSGVLLGADKKVASKLLIPESIEKLFVVDDHIAAVSSGLVGDARRLVELARNKAQENMVFYEEPIHVETLVKEISSLMQAYTQYGGMRPFGVSFLVGGVDEAGKHLFETEPSGALAEYKADAIGNGRNEAMALFEKDFEENLSYEEGVNLMMQAIKKTLPENEKMDASRLDFAKIEEKGKFTRISRDELKTLLGKK